MDPIADVEVLSVVAVLRGRHALEGHKEIVKATRARQPAVERRVQNALPARQLLLRVTQGQRLQVFLGADSDPSLEQPLKVVGAQSDRVGRLRQGRLFAKVCPEKSERFGCPFVIRVWMGLCSGHDRRE